MSELSELFERDPCKLSDQDLQVIIKTMRENQAQYELGAKPAAVAPRPRAVKPKAQVTVEVADLLKDLGL